VSGPEATSVPDGLLVVDKPEDWSSHDVVARVRRLAGTRKVGHAGTLDPMATGVLVLGIGKGTKLLTFLVGCDKDYTATIRLGQETTTDDAQGEPVPAPEGQGRATDLTEPAIAAAVATLTGDITQVPSSVSAIKVRGERAYARVRAGEEVVLAARPVRVDRFVVHRLIRDPAGAPGCLDLDVAVSVSSGTYVRALARDLGRALGVGGHLTALRRTRVGTFGLDTAYPLAELTARRERGETLPLLPLATAAASALPSRTLTPQDAVAVGRGQRIASAQPGRADLVAALGPAGELVAILDESRSAARSRVVFTPASS